MQTKHTEVRRFLEVSLLLLPWVPMNKFKSSDVHSKCFYTLSYLVSPNLIFWHRVFHWIRSSLIWLVCIASELWGSTFLHFPSIGVTGVCWHTQMFIWVLGSVFRSSCLCGRLFTQLSQPSAILLSFIPVQMQSKNLVPKGIGAYSKLNGCPYLSNTKLPRMACFCERGVINLKNIFY